MTKSWEFLGYLVLVHRQVESTVSWLTKFEGILHGDFAASCGEGLSHSAKIDVGFADCLQR